MTDTIRMNVTPTQYGILSKLLDVGSLRQRVIAQNIANVNTPGYHRLGVTFEDSLTKQLLETGDVDPDRLEPKLFEDLSGTFRVDGNNVDISQEMMRLNKNTLLHTTYLQILSSKIATMRRAISGV